MLRHEKRPILLLALLLACGTPSEPPIVIAPEATYRDTLQVFAGEPSNNMHPRFEVQEASGTYRLVWQGVVHDYDHDRHGFGDPVPLAQRISNTFELERE